MNEMTNNQDNKNSGRDKEPFLRRAMDAFGTMFALNICFVIGCIPIFTIGASFTALYAMWMEFVTYEQDGFVGVITINRPKALNALNSTVLEELDATFKAVDLNTTRCLVLTGA